LSEVEQSRQWFAIRELGLRVTEFVEEGIEEATQGSRTLERVVY